MDEFDAFTCREIGTYVYALIDPRTKKPFYLGKGTGNRVFAHVNEAQDLDRITDKLDLIREIKDEGCAVEHIILRHGLDERTALIVESSLLDFADYFNLNLTNLVLGHHASTYGVMTVEELSRKYSTPPLECLGEDCVMININKRYNETKGSSSLYEITKEYWAMSNPSERIKYVLAEFKSFIVEVFEVTEWYTVDTGKRLRWGFNGSVAPDEIRNLYFNRKIFKKRGTANPISYKLQKLERPIEMDSMDETSRKS